MHLCSLLRVVIIPSANQVCRGVYSFLSILSIYLFVPFWFWDKVTRNVCISLLKFTCLLTEISWYDFGAAADLRSRSLTYKIALTFALKLRCVLWYCWVEPFSIRLGKLTGISWHHLAAALVLRSRSQIYKFV